LGLRTSSAILFNHESHLRPTHFVSKRIISGLVDVFENKREFIEIHNPNVERDWGSANEYVKAMRLIAMSNHNDDFIVASGECNSIKRFIEIALNKLSISRSFEEVVRVKKESDRPLDHRGVAGDSSKIQKVLGWTTNSNFETLVEELVQSELSLRSKHAW